MNLDSLKNREYWIGLIIVLGIAYIPLFDSLGSLPIVLWDESRLAVSALEMYDSGNWLYLTYEGVPDHWNAKPPMMIWMQVISLKLFGLNEFAIRFPTAMAGLSTCILLYWFFGKKMQKPILGIITCAVLLTSQGYVKIHAARTGDFDTLLTLFIVSYSLFYYLYLKEEKKKYLIVTIIAMILAVLTKGIAALIISPALLIFTVYEKKLLFVLKEPRLYIGIASFLVIILGYYFLRDHYDKNYIADMIDNEITGRFGKTGNDANDNKWYYHGFFNVKTFKWWFRFLPVGLCVGLLADGKKWRSLTVFAVIFSIIQFVFVSMSKSKAEWYDMPSYPYFAIVAGLAVYFIYSYIKKEGANLKLKRNVLPYLFLVLVFMEPAKAIYIRVKNPDIGLLVDKNINMGYYLKGIVKDKSKSTDNLAIVNGEYCADVLWYSMVLKHQGREVPLVNIGNLDSNQQKVIVFEDNVKQQIENTFNFEQVDNFRNVTLYRLYGKK